MKIANQRILVCREDPWSPDALQLLDELSESLEAITGSTGRASFSPEDIDDPRAVFAVARDGSGTALGCGAIRPLDERTAEVKRMYARVKGRSVGSLLLAFLEDRARELGFAALRLETRKVNETAVAFYLARGYRVIENYGRYAGRDEAVCFEKVLLAKSPL